MSRTLALHIAAALAAVAAWAGDPAPFRAPARLSATGLYAGPGTGTIDPRNLPYAPQYPLWTDGATKTRWFYLPPGATIDVSDLGAWRFPVGTKLWKEFSFDGRKVETRMIWRAAADTWVFASYVWNDEQTDALLAPDAGIRDHAPIAAGKFHSIPGLIDCKSCHESAPAPVLGFNALQLSDDRDPMALHSEPLKPGMVTLSTLEAAHRLDPSRPDLVTSPPRIEAATPRERAVLGYFAGNCGHCHNASGPIARVGLVLAHDPVLPERKATQAATASLIDRKGRFQVPSVPDGTSRLVAPGAPDRSAVLYRMRSRRPSSQMPPLGTVIADQEAVSLVEGWIAEDLVPAHEAIEPGR
jgi:hypothetical protein